MKLPSQLRVNGWREEGGVGNTSTYVQCGTSYNGDVCKMLWEEESEVLPPLGENWKQHILSYA